MRLAIVLGVSEYDSQTRLAACRNDAQAFEEVLRQSGEYKDICALYGNIPAAKGKKAITEFISKHQGEAVSELLFFFSGHGAREESDFLHIFSDFSIKSKEATSLRNTELDALIRNLAPDLTVKVVDACYSGSQYIKSDEDVQPALMKSARENSLKKVYFLHSSNASETSLAGPSYSVFTESVLKTIARTSGELRYRDLIAGVADDLSLQSVPKPTFVIQADNLERFLHVTDALATAIKARVGGLNSGGNPKEEANGQTTMTSELSAPEDELATLAAKHSRDVFCTQEEAAASLALFDSLVDVSGWPADIRQAFDISVSDIEVDKMPNAVALGRWLETRKADDLFAQPTYRTETYEAEEYKEVPKKPKGAREVLFSIGSLLGDDPSYKLVTVNKVRQVVTGFKHAVDPIFSPKVIQFTPKLSSLENYVANVVCFFSRRTVHLVFSVEHLPYTQWDVVSQPQARDWKPITAQLKDRSAVGALATAAMADIAEFIRSDAKQRLAALAT